MRRPTGEAILAEERLDSLYHRDIGVTSTGRQGWLLRCRSIHLPKNSRWAARVLVGSPPTTHGYVGCTFLPREDRVIGELGKEDLLCASLNTKEQNPNVKQNRLPPVITRVGCDGACRWHAG